MPGKDDDSRSWYIWVGAAGAALGAWWLLSSKRDYCGEPIKETDFDNFLVKQTGQKTGLTSGGKAKKRQAARGSFYNVSASDRGKVSGPFETFLKREEDDEEEEDDDPRNPLDFNSFLKTALPASKGGKANGQVVVQPEAQKPKPAAGPLPHQARVLVMFGTEYGFSKEIAEKLCDQLREAGAYWPVLQDMAEHASGYDLASEQVVIMACSTQGDGVPPTEAREFCEWLFAGKAGSLANTSFSVCALGDKAYAHFCRCGKQLDEALGKAGAKRFVPRQDVNKEDWEAINGWLSAIVDGLPKLGLKPVGEAGVAAAAAADAKSAAGSHAPKRWGKSRPYPARVVAVEPLCVVSGKEDKNTVRLELDLGDSGLQYAPGDALGIYPRNAPKYVDELLAQLSADGSQQVPTPSWHYEDATTSGGEGRPSSVTLKEALTACYDLKSPKAELLQLLWQGMPETARQVADHHLGKQPNGTAATKANGEVKANGSAVHVNGDATAHVHASTNGKATAEGDQLHHQAQVLSALIHGGAAAQEAYFATGRHVVDVLREFNTVTLTVAQLLSGLRQLQPRLYSISSSPLEGSTRVQATIAEVKYDAHGCERIGVCSTFVSERIAVGQLVPAYIHKNPDFRLPPAPSTPILMVGPGTGLAPFRSYILHRLLEAKQQGGAGTKPGQMVLYFGCRRSDQDYLYGPQLEQWAASGDITLYTAFSRQTAKKVYVQDRLRETSDLVWSLIHEQGAHFYVCGDASSMAGAVEKELLNVISARLPGVKGGVKEGQKASEAAAAYLEELSKTGRYQRDVWY